MLTGIGMSEYAKSKLKTPYFYGAKIQDGVLTENKMSTMHRLYPSTVTTAYMAKARAKKQVGVVNVDCSGIMAGYRNKNIGSYQLYSTAYTRLPIAKVKEFAVGTVLWKSGHVGIYIGIENGIPMCIEAKGINYGTIKSKVSATAWKYGLTFSDLSYDYSKNLSKESTWKGMNPYTEPTTLIKKGSVGSGAKWVQWELREAGFNVPFEYAGKKYKEVSIDGIAGAITEVAIKAFQHSCKLELDKTVEVDGKCGTITRKYLKLNT